MRQYGNFIGRMSGSIYYCGAVCSGGSSADGAGETEKADPENGSLCRNNSIDEIPLIGTYKRGQGFLPSFVCRKPLASELFRKITMKVLTMQLNSITIMDLIAYGGGDAGGHHGGDAIYK